MHSKWLKGHKDREARTKEILSYKNAFDELAILLEQEETKNPDRKYDADWHHRQIAVNEWNAAIQHVINLIKLDKE
jgi:hypothetical protein